MIIQLTARTKQSLGHMSNKVFARDGVFPKSLFSQLCAAVLYESLVMGQVRLILRSFDETVNGYCKLT